MVDFSSLRALDKKLKNQFDHTFLVNSDDPLLFEWEKLHKREVLDLRVMENVGMEFSAKLVWQWANTLLFDREQGRSCCWKVEACENEFNSAFFELTPEWYKP